MKVYVVRHGETDLNSRGLLQGIIDEPLNQNGIDLAVITGKALADVPFDVIYSSPLIRAKKTAEIIAEECRKAQGRKRAIPIITDVRLREIQFGDYELKCVIPGKQDMDDPENYMKLSSDPFNYEPRGKDAESIRDVIDRTGAFWDEMVAKKKLQNKTILIAMHGCATRALLNRVYEDKTDYWHGGVPGNCAVNILEIKNGKVRFIEEDKLYYDPAMCVNYY